MLTNICRLNHATFIAKISLQTNEFHLRLIEKKILEKLFSPHAIPAFGWFPKANENENEGILLHELYDYVSISRISSHTKTKKMQ